jgi:hypothetical protein
MKALPVVILLAGCSAFHPEHWAEPAPFHCATNPADRKAIVLAQARFASTQLGWRGPSADVIRTLDVREAKPQKRVCFRWPWISEEGRIGIVVGRDTLWSAWMNPWARR